MIVACWDRFVAGCGFGFPLSWHHARRIASLRILRATIGLRFFERGHEHSVRNASSKSRSRSRLPRRHGCAILGVCRTVWQRSSQGPMGGVICFHREDQIPAGQRPPKRASCKVGSPLDFSVSFVFLCIFEPALHPANRPRRHAQLIPVWLSSTTCSDRLGAHVSCDGWGRVCRLVPLR